MIIPTLLRSQDQAAQADDMPVTQGLSRAFCEPRTVCAPQREISYLLSAAVVNRRFAECLLTDRARALDVGYQGRAFQFSRADREQILGIRASTVQEFAAELAHLFPVRQELL